MVTGHAQKADGLGDNYNEVEEFVAIYAQQTDGRGGKKNIFKGG